MLRVKYQNASEIYLFTVYNSRSIFMYAKFINQNRQLQILYV